MLEVCIEHFANMIHCLFSVLQAMGNFENEPTFKCSICLRPFRTPRVLPCQHCFCTKCLSDYIIETQAQDNSSSMMFYFSCPICRKAVPRRYNAYKAVEFPINYTIQSILDEYRVMKIFEERILYRRVNNDKSVMTSVETTSRSIQTDELPGNRGINTSNIGIHREILDHLVGPFISGECFITSQLKRGIIFVFSQIIIFIYFLIMSIFIKQVELEGQHQIVATLSVSLLFQILFVGIKFPHRIYAFLGYLLAYFLTLLVFRVTMEMYINHISRYVVLQNYGCACNNETVYGFKVQDIQLKFKEAERINFDQLDSKQKAVAYEYFIYTTYRLQEVTGELFIYCLGASVLSLLVYLFICGPMLSSVFSVILFVLLIQMLKVL